MRNQKNRKPSFILALALSVYSCGQSIAADDTAFSPVLDTPYGVCSHVTRGDERSRAKETFDTINNLGINWVRTDFDWNAIERSRDTWTFSRLDHVLATAKTDNINILPILASTVAWGDPSWKHPELWGNFVRQVVTRYGKDLRHWEVYNEPNHGSFWGAKPNGADYAGFLKHTYNEIKKVDLDLTVLYGGLLGVDLPYFEDSLKAGAGDYFDVVNVHPYFWTGKPETIPGRLTKLRALMNRYNIGHKPIWITEVGWSTADWDLDPLAIQAAFKYVGIDPAVSTIAMLCDPQFGEWGTPYLYTSEEFGFGNRADIQLKDLKNLDVKKYPALAVLSNETFPSSHRPEIRDYVARGGTLLILNGRPFYFDIKDGQRFHENNRFARDLHVGWDAWWEKNKKVPQKEIAHRRAPQFAVEFEILWQRPVGYSLSTSNLKPGDEYIPVIETFGEGGFKGSILGIYKLNSDLKGNVIVSLQKRETVTENYQAQLLPRTYLLSLANGVDRIFWYAFRDRNKRRHEREDHFGIAYRDFTLKPSGHAYHTLTRLCPDGSTRPVITETDRVYTASWIRPDGKKTWAIWTPDLVSRPVSLQIGGEVSEAFDHLGAPQSIPAGGKTNVTSSILYLLGADSLAVSPL